MRLINAESPQNGIFVFDLVIEEMKKIPTVDIDRPTRSQFKRMAVQLGYEKVVHCKDCKHLMFSGYYGECGAGRMGIVGLLDFCSYGKKRTDFVDDNKIGERRTDADEPAGT